MLKSQEKFSRAIGYGLSANTEKLPSESPFESIFMVEPVIPEIDFLFKSQSFYMFAIQSSKIIHLCKSIAVYLFQ